MTEEKLMTGSETYPSVSLSTRNQTEMRHEPPREPAGASAASTLSSGTLLLVCVLL